MYSQTIFVRNLGVFFIVCAGTLSFAHYVSIIGGILAREMECLNDKRMA